jgi:hypothetical protein
MTQKTPPEETVDRQTLAYNARDIDAYCSLYASDAVISTFNTGIVHAQGVAAIRSYYSDRFKHSPNLHCDVIRRIKLGNFVIDHERVVGILAEAVEVIAIYEVRDSMIRSLRLIRA